MKRRTIALWIAIATIGIFPSDFLVGAQAQQPEPALPDFDRFVTEVKSRLQLDQRLVKNYTYEQRNIRKHLDKSGRVKKTETRVYEIFPADDPKLTYRRLIERDGKPVSESELKKQDREYEKRRAAREKKRRKQDPEDESKARQEEAEAIEEAFRVFEITMEAREIVHDRPAIRFSFMPKLGAKAKSDEAKMLLNFRGRVWFDEALYELVRLEVEAIKDVSFGFGLLAKLHKGAKGHVERRLFNDEVWLPSSTQFRGNLRLLLFKSMKMEVTDEFFDYRKFTVETSVSFAPK